MQRRQCASHAGEDSRCQTLVVVVRLLAMLEGLAVLLCAMPRRICSSIKDTQPSFPQVPVMVAEILAVEHTSNEV